MSQPIERVPVYGTDENATYDALLQRVQNIGQNRAVTSQQQRNGSDVSRELEKRADELNLSPEAQAQLRKLQQRDREVRAHESAHLSAAGQHAVGGAQYQYQKGPDGRMYAIGGHVSIDTSSAFMFPKSPRFRWESGLRLWETESRYPVRRRRYL